jgi:hypothetical protein
LVALLSTLAQYISGHTGAVQPFCFRLAQSAATLTEVSSTPDNQPPLPLFCTQILRKLHFLCQLHCTPQCRWKKRSEVRIGFLRETLNTLFIIRYVGGTRNDWIYFICAAPTRQSKYGSSASLFFFAAPQHCWLLLLPYRFFSALLYISLTLSPGLPDDVFSNQKSEFG